MADDDILLQAWRLHKKIEADREEYVLNEDENPCTYVARVDAAEKKRIRGMKDGIDEMLGNKKMYDENITDWREREEKKQHTLEQMASSMETTSKWFALYLQQQCGIQLPPPI